MGWPVGHSLSPLLHGYWLKEYGDRRRAGACRRQPEGFRRVDRAGCASDGFPASMSPCRTRKRPSHWPQTCDKAAESAARSICWCFMRRPDRRPQHRSGRPARKPCSENSARTAWPAKPLCCWARAARRGRAVLALDELGAARSTSSTAIGDGPKLLAHAWQPHGRQASCSRPALDGWASVAPAAALAGQHHQRRHERP